METSTIKPYDQVLTFIDIGTNSIRMIIIGLKSNKSYVVIREEKEIVRLGESVFKKGLLVPKAMKRAVVVCKKFVELAHTFHTDEIIALATCATREARNQAEFIEKLNIEANISVRVISGTEEARLMYLGVSSGVHIEKTKTLFIDIGGGSTEIALGDQYSYQHLETLGLGSIRLTAMFLKDNGVNPISEQTREQMKAYIRNKILRSVERLHAEEMTLSIGSSGTIINLGEIAWKEYHKNNSKRDLSFKLKELKKIIGMLSSVDIKKRQKIPGINPERADIIVPGALILETLMEEFHVKEITVSKFGLRHGMVIDYLRRHGILPEPEAMTVRERSILHLARMFSINEQHAKTVQDLALQLFDSAKELKMHRYGTSERELLSYAAYLHDIGNFISFRNHHHHSYYIISNAELPGFDQMEINILSAITRFHRKKLPLKKHSEMRKLDKQSQKIVIKESLFLRIAEKLDRSHSGCISNARFTHADDTSITLTVDAERECELEIWGIESLVKLFQKVFKKQLLYEVHKAEAKMVAT